VGGHRKATLTWQTGLRFHAEAGSGHQLVVDSTGRPGHQGASPMELMLVAVAGCTAIDVAAILEKMREPLTSLHVEVTGEQAESNPKYFKAIEILYRVGGRGVTREKVERAVHLSHSTYCSAVASLRPDCSVESRIEILDE
jgi:putative redox protein